jgi:hypothetical protein
MNGGPIVKWVLLIACVWLAALALYAISIITRRSARVSSEKLFGERISEEDFETHLQLGFRHRGYLVEGSHGNDLVIRRGGEITLVSYQHWDEPYRVEKRVAQLRRAMQAQGAAGGKLICGFTLPRRIERSLRAGAIDCIGPRELRQLMAHASARDVAQDGAVVTSFRPEAAAGPVTVPGREAAPLLADPPHLHSAVALPPEQRPLCPRCNAQMQLETAEGGGANGLRYWRCVRAPDCKGIRTASASLQNG